jgi:hypothetical protein
VLLGRFDHLPHAQLLARLDDETGLLQDLAFDRARETLERPDAATGQNPASFERRLGSDTEKNMAGRVNDERGTTESRQRSCRR